MLLSTFRNFSKCRVLVSAVKLNTGNNYPVFSGSKFTASLVQKRNIRFMASEGGGFSAESEIVPDVISKAPRYKVEVKYGNLTVDQGNELTPTQVKDIPTSVDWPTEEDGLYTLCMTDPDAPCRKTPKYREWHHWLVVNIPKNKISEGTVMSEYVGSGPPQGTGLHRYVFLVYKQPGIINCSEKKLTNRSGNHRGNFKIESFAKKYNLGDPIAGNYYVAQWDDYVPLLYEQLAAED